MTDAVRELYETRVYPAMSHPLSDPALSGAAAMLAGLPVRQPSAARILEIGCASGHNLIPLAMRWPESRFVGIDLSEAAIETARELAAAAGVSNVQFHAADLRDFDAGGERFDFIIAHGFFSWVPDAVKAALLEFCQRTLAAEGMATVSFNLESGWLPRWPVIQKARAILAAGAEDEMAALAILRTVTDPDSHEWAIIDDMMAKGPGILPFDDFAPVNDPWSLERFLAAADAAGLRCLGESDLGVSDSEWKTFHSSILCRVDAPLGGRVSWSTLERIAVTAGDFSETGDPVLRELALAGPGFISVADLETRLPRVERSELGLMLLDGMRRGWILPRTEALDFNRIPPEFPVLNGFRLECARRGLPLVDARHRPCSFPKGHSEVLARMDGTRDQASLEAFARIHCPELDFRPWLRHLAGRGMFA